MSASGDTVYVCVSDPVEIDANLFRLWAEGYSADECFERVKQQAINQYEKSRTQRQIHRLFQCVRKDVLDQLRVFEMLEPALREPALRPFKVQAVGPDQELLMVRRYFQYDPRVVRSFLGWKLSTKTRRKLSDIAPRVRARLRSVERQFDNVRCFVLRLMQLEDGSRPGGKAKDNLSQSRLSTASSLISESLRRRLVQAPTGASRPDPTPRTQNLARLIQSDYGLEWPLAESYAAFAFLCFYRLECSRGTLSALSTDDLELIAQHLISHWTIPVMAPTARTKDVKLEVVDGGAATGPQSVSELKSLDRKEENGYLLDRAFIQRLRLLKNKSKRSGNHVRRMLDAYTARVRSMLQTRLVPSGADPASPVTPQGVRRARSTSGTGSESRGGVGGGRGGGGGGTATGGGTGGGSGGFDKLIRRCDSIVRALVGIAVRLPSEKDFREVLVSLLGNVVAPVCRIGLRPHVIADFFATLVECSAAPSDGKIAATAGPGDTNATNSIAQEKLLDTPRDWTRFLRAVGPICGRLANALLLHREATAGKHRIVNSILDLKAKWGKRTAVSPVAPADTPN